MNTSTGIAVALAVAVAMIFLFFGPSIFNLFSTSSPMALEPQEQNGPTVGFGLSDVVVGTGATAEPGKTVTVSYVGRFTDGTVFDASANHGGSFSFVLGEGQVIQGWERGIPGMKVGGQRVLTVPPELGYGPNDYGPIPGNSVLIFEVELLDVR